jgi:hypothetical protein
MSFTLTFGIAKTSKGYLYSKLASFGYNFSARAKPQKPNFTTHNSNTLGLQDKILP